MTVKKTTDYFRVLLYFLFGAALLFLRYIGDNAEPIGLALVYAMNAAGLSPFVSSLSFFLVSLPQSEFSQILLSAGQALVLAVSFLIERRLRKTTAKRTWFLPLFCLSLSLGRFVAFAPFTPYKLPFDLGFTLGALPQKVAIAACVFLLSAVFTVAIKALLKKFLKCRLSGDEIVFSVLFFILVGVGICRFLSVNAYMGIALFVLLVFACATKDATAIVCAFVLSLPPALVGNLSPERFFFYGVAITLFMKSGRLAAALATLGVFFVYGYFDGLYTFETSLLVQSLLSAVLPTLLFILIPTPVIRELENKLVFYREKHLSRIAINRNRAAIGEQLFEISSVFREIQTTFAALGTTEAEEGAKEYIRGLVKEETCKTCPQYRACGRKGVFDELGKLIDVGCLKGKANLIDVPSRLAEVCVNQSGVLYAVNRQIGDYTKYMTETENAAAGRALLAGQAQGVSEILKTLAIEQSEPLRIYTDKERALNIALLSVGVVCSEVLVYGEEDNPTLSLITFGKADVKKIAAVASELCNAPMIISERLALSRDKFCCILRKKPYFDAAFGVACAKKTGEVASGDTHSVLRIDERRFMVALSDGMGSGEYARRISESTISLLESFYRAKMPSESVLSTINKLLTFSKEETFACVDIAVVDLDNGKADIVKIGSPVGFILSGNTVKVLEGGSLPLGILDSLRPDTASYELMENDVLLFLSDGITGAFGSTTDLYDVLKSIPAHNPQELTDTLLDRALNAYGGVAKDDMTALAVRLFKAAA
ncbi:MAG: SpoIIE family protein phosphatase [Clostridia bacterium]|nr:SpoIIE family protein phosphatase [Clostridia bacterium]